MAAFVKIAGDEQGHQHDAPGGERWVSIEAGHKRNNPVRPPSMQQNPSCEQDQQHTDQEECRREEPAHGGLEREQYPLHRKKLPMHFPAETTFPQWWRRQRERGGRWSEVARGEKEIQPLKPT